MLQIAYAPASIMPRVGQNHIYTPCMTVWFGDFPTKNTVHTIYTYNIYIYVWFWPTLIMPHAHTQRMPTQTNRVTQAMLPHQEHLWDKRKRNHRCHAAISRMASLGGEEGTFSQAVWLTCCRPLFASKELVCKLGYVSSKIKRVL